VFCMGAQERQVDAAVLVKRSQKRRGDTEILDAVPP
jgi:hypothetical protein